MSHVSRLVRSENSQTNRAKIATITGVREYPNMIIVELTTDDSKFLRFEISYKKDEYTDASIVHRNTNFSNAQEVGSSISALQMLRDHLQQYPDYNAALSLIQS